MSNASMKNYLPNFIEYAAIIILGLIVYYIELNNWMRETQLYVLIVILSLGKAVWFVYESSKQIVKATHQNMAYHTFLYAVGINMTQIVISFAADYYLLYHVNKESFNGINPDFTEGELVFECIYFSCLNFSFFGYGDITPNNVPAKIVTLSEIMLAFATVIFILSDFVTLKDSIKDRRKN
jgi:Ion channel